MSRFSALWLGAIAVATVTTGGFAVIYNPVSTCYSSGLLISCAHAIACENYYTHLQCDPGDVLRIHEVDYGRQDYATCGAGRPLCELQNLHCSTPGMTYRVAKQCNGKNTCSVRASSNWFTDPCPGTYKYLQVAYFCEPLKVVCEQHTAHLHCEEGKVIRIHAAEYGRRDRTTCSAGRPVHQVQNVYCSTSLPAYILGKMCNGKNTCTITASSSVFGDPCYGIYKYLQLSFFCI